MEKRFGTTPLRMIATGSGSGTRSNWLREDPQPTPEKHQRWIDLIEALPGELRALVQDLSDRRLDTPYRPGGWTIRQVVHHLADMRRMNGRLREAAERGHRIVMTPQTCCYLDYHQDANRSTTGRLDRTVTLRTAHSLEPIPRGLPRSIRPTCLGAQGNLWCDRIGSFETAGYHCGCWKRSMRAGWQLCARWTSRRSCANCTTPMTARRP